MQNDAIALAADLCRTFEGYRATPYLCPAGVVTVGYGATRYPDGRVVLLNDSPISYAQAESMLQHDLLVIAPIVLRLCPTVAGDSRRAAAIIDFAYNLGWPRLRASTLRKKVNSEDWGSAGIEILRWDKAGGKVLKGLALRRQAEAALLRG